MLLCDGSAHREALPPSVPANNLKDLFDLVLKEPQKFTFGATRSARPATLPSSFSSARPASTRWWLPTRGLRLRLPNLMSGQIQLLADPMLSIASAPLAQGGQIKALGLTSSKRAPAAPEIPTIAEVGRAGLRLCLVVRVMGAEQPCPPMSRRPCRPMSGRYWRCLT